MKFLKLKFLRFGTFADYQLDLSSDNSNFHVIFGANERGKSTSLRAITALLFGIPENTTDDHLYPNNELLIGGLLEGDKGLVLEILRRKGRKNTLMDNNNNPLEETVLSALLGVNRELFQTMFGLSHDELVNGGKDLLAGKGELGESLFGASTGVRNIHALRISLGKEAEEIFKSSGQNPPLNLAIKTFHNAKNQIREASLKPKDWEDVQEKLQKEQAQLKHFVGERQQNDVELNRLQRLKRVIPQVRKRQVLITQQTDLGQVTIISEESVAKRKEAQTVIGNSVVAEQKLMAATVQLKTKIENLNVPEKILNREPAIESIQDHLGAHKKAIQDLPGLQAKQEALHQDIQVILKNLGWQDSLENIETYRVNIQTSIRIRKLAKEFAILETATQKAQKDLDLAQSSLQRYEAENKTISLPQDISPLKQIIIQARKRGDLETEYGDLMRKIANLEAAAQNNLSALLLWAGPLEKIAGLPLPPEKTISRFQTEFEELNNRNLRAAEKKAEFIQNLEQVKQELLVLEAGGTVPTEAELNSTRIAREEYWQTIRSNWLDNTPLTKVLPSEIAEHYEEKVQSADEISDQLWRDADRASKYAVLQGSIIKSAEDISEIDQQLITIQAQTNELQNQWTALWTLANVVPLPPAEMLSWLGRHEKLVNIVLELSTLKTDQQLKQADIQTQLQVCQSAIKDVGYPDNSANQSLAATLDNAEHIIEELSALKQRKEQILLKIEETSILCREHERELKDCQKKTKQWRSEWKQAVASLKLNEDSAPEEAETILDKLTELFQKLDESVKDQHRIEAIEADAKVFTDEVNRLILESMPKLKDRPIIEAAGELILRFRKAKEAARDRDTFGQQLAEILEQLDDLKRNRENAQAVVDSLLKKAGCATLEELQKAEILSKEYQQITTELAQIEEQLLTEGIPLQDLIDQALATDPDILPGSITELSENLARLTEETGKVQQEIGRLKHEIATMDGAPLAANAALDAQEALAAIREHVEHYTRLKLSALILDQEIERYRKENQGPILHRAGEILQQITLNAYTRLSTGFDTHDRPILLCVRNNEKTVEVEGLSDGTRDQLYLALRFAGIEQHLQHNQPLPLVIDDLLINFDDERSAATLEYLGELAKKTQVLFFTHHGRMVEIAQKAVDGEMLMVHEL